MCGSFQIRAHMRYYVKRSKRMASQEVQVRVRTSGHDAADRTVAALLKHVVFAGVESQEDGEGPAPAGIYFPFIFLLTASFSLTGLSLREASAMSRASSSSSM